MTVRRVKEIERIDSLASFSSYCSFIATEFGRNLVVRFRKIEKEFCKIFFITCTLIINIH